MSRVFDCAKPDERETGIEEAAAALRSGELVVLPTDTVYGVGADAFLPAAIDALLTAKGRDRSMPVPVLVSSPAMLDALVDQMPAPATALSEKFWPGGLTLVVRHTAHLVWDLGDSRGTVAVRMPADQIAQDLISRTGPLAVSSANRTGHDAATTAMEARLQLGAAVSVYLDGGSSGGSVASTIIDVTGERPRLLRTGVLDLGDLREVVPDLQVEGE
ncbi:MAG TPA: L-threonylcarbamoyladenylate synthase [Mycobacteriales bacterium]|jgi:tRNA threonylcarbamoyl adenosine modification protein (Sua5/YciO/YrdC/YwlC family)|nr:L-threonylcarbamoyladenylate synthase [Mycobacteriales bacterium]